MLAKKRYKASSRIKKRSDTKKNLKRGMGIVLCIMVLVGPIFALRADFLQIKSFEVVGVETLSVEELQNKAKNFASGTRFYFLPKSNILLLNKENLASTILSAFSNVESVSVDKKFDKTVRLLIKERKPEYFWCSDSLECFYMDKNGLIYEKTEDRGARIIFLGGINGDPIKKNFATAEQMQNYLKVIEILENAKLQIGSINLELADKAIFKTDVSDIFLNPEEDMSLTAQNAVLLINETRLKNPSFRFNYIDARFGNKVFYK